MVWDGDGECVAVIDTLGDGVEVAVMDWLGVVVGELLGVTVVEGEALAVGVLEAGTVAVVVEVRVPVGAGILLIYQLNTIKSEEILTF